LAALIKQVNIMQDTIVIIYCLCDDLLKTMQHRDDPQTKLSSAEVMTVPLVAATFFHGNQGQAQRFLQEHGYIRTSLSRSRFNRRLHALPSEVWNTLFSLLAQVFKQHNPSLDYVVDSLPVPVCDNIRIRRCQLLQGQEYRGYCASKRRYFYGLKVHLLITGTGAPVEFVLTPGSTSDVKALRQLTLDIPAGSTLHGDRAYTDYHEEDLLQESGAITLQPQRKKNSLRPLAPWLEFLSKPIRQRIETSFSQITRLFPKHIHAVTPRGFVLKLVCFLLAFSISQLYVATWVI
jgi:hypothetical protein